MGNLWLKIKVWFKATLLSAIAIYVLIFLFKNGGRQASLWWWFGHDNDTTVLYLAFGAFIAGVLMTLLVRTIWVTYRQLQGMTERSRSLRLEREVLDMKTKAAMLQTRPATGPAMGPVVNSELKDPGGP